MATEERFTLEEARRQLALEECRNFGHRYEFIQTVMLEPIRFYCMRCHRSWDATPADMTGRLPTALDLSATAFDG